METLREQSCKKFSGTLPKLSQTEQETLLAQVTQWKIIDNHLRRNIACTNFLEALALVNKLSEIAEIENHHPLLSFTWGKVIIELWTHTAGGLTLLDFILAAKFEALIEKTAKN